MKGPDYKTVREGRPATEESILLCRHTPIVEESDNGTDCFTCYCKFCHLFVRGDTREEVLRKWNAGEDIRSSYPLW